VAPSPLRGRPTPTATLRVTLAAEGHAAQRARDHTVAFLGWTHLVAGPVVHAPSIVFELVANVVEHAYEPDRRGSATVELGLAEELLTILVSDDGRGPHAGSPSPGPGRGWRLVSFLSDEFTITDRGQPGGTLVQVRLGLA
jgi:anti-sigma regulatory factor (Ser/Thr protein kinase)